MVYYFSKTSLNELPLIKREGERERERERERESKRKKKREIGGRGTKGR